VGTTIDRDHLLAVSSQTGMPTGVLDTRSGRVHMQLTG
jgi:hypothetical protein